MILRRTESLHPEAKGLHSLPVSVLASRVVAAQLAALRAVEPAIPALVQAAEAGAQALRSGGRMGYAGAGSSGLMALADCLELPGTFGLPPDRVPMMFAGGAEALLHMTGGVEDDPALARADIDRAGISAGDVVLCLAASGGTPYTLTIAELARARGAVVVGIANTEGSALLAGCDIPVLLDTGPEIIAGSTRMGAGSAQKLALNVISVLVGSALGHVHDGYMVNVTADNAKLKARAARIVGVLAGVDDGAALAALGESGGAVKPAVLIARGMGPQDALAALAESGGHLAPLLAQDDA